MNENALYLLFNGAFNNATTTSVDDYRQFYESEGYKYDEPEPLKDAGLASDVLVAKQEAQKTGNQKLANTLDFILKYGDKALTVLTKNGIIRNQNLVAAGYDTGVNTVIDKTDTTSNAPDTKNRVFNVDFTDPKVLIIIFLLFGIGGYFLFRTPAKAKR